MPGDVIRVLVVDDNEMLRQTLAEALDDRDIRVVGQATDGEQACWVAQEVRPDVVVMDIRMPSMSGPEATAWLTKQFPDLRVVALTAYEDAALHQAMTRAGAVSVIVKGTSLREIVGAIRAASVKGGATLPAQGSPQ
jgi:DNA-binding NarL/FixJ family response regulator